MGKKPLNLRWWQGAVTISKGVYFAMITTLLATGIVNIMYAVSNYQISRENAALQDCVDAKKTVCPMGETVVILSYD